MPDARRVLEELARIRNLDVNASSGRLFTYIYETGIPELREVASRAFSMFLGTNALDPTVFRSAFFFEKELVSHALHLMNAPEAAVGTVTYGGTESIMLAVLAARRWYRRVRDGGGRVLVPVTGHPSIRKAAEYLGLGVEYLSVDPESKKLDIEDLKEKIDDNVALIVVSAPNFPYGTVDPVKEAAEIAAEKGVPVHVDACVGGYILPYLERLGLDVPVFDFRVEGVTSISMDLHKYGYSPKGASVVLFRSGEYKEGTVFVDLRWPGYPLINTTVLSSRSVAPMAAAWATLQFLGDEGYMELARRIVEARDRILSGLSRLGFRSLAPVESPLLSLALGSDNETLKYYAWMQLWGWVLGLQRRVEGLAPYNIHLTVMPVHAGVVGEFLEDSRKAVESPPPRELQEILSQVERDPLAAAERIGGSPLDGVLVAKILESVPPEYAEDLARALVVEVFRG